MISKVRPGRAAETLQILLHDPDDQERFLGLGTYCLMDAEGATYYGGIREAALTDTTLSLAFTDEAPRNSASPPGTSVSG